MNLIFQVWGAETHGGLGGTTTLGVSTENIAQTDLPRFAELIGDTNNEGVASRG